MWLDVKHVGPIGFDGECDNIHVKRKSEDSEANGERNMHGRCLVFVRDNK